MVSEDLDAKKVPEKEPDFIVFIVYTKAMNHPGHSIIDNVRVGYRVFNKIHEWRHVQLPVAKHHANGKRSR